MEAVTVSAVAARLLVNALKNVDFADLVRRSSEIFSTPSGEAHKQLEEARVRYREQITDPTSRLELHRAEVLSRLTKLHAKTRLKVSNAVLLETMLSMLVAQATETYKARTEQDLTMVELSIGEVEGAFQQYEDIVDRRKSARRYAVLFSIGALIGLGLLIFWGTRPNGPSVDDVFPIIQVPLPIVVWSAIGSFTAILYRFNKSGDVELQDPLRWLFTRPLTGIVMGTIAFFVLKVGFLSVLPNENSPGGSTEILWLVAFITGFSDRLADSTLKLLAGQFGGDVDAGLVDFEELGSPLLPPSIEGVQSLLVKRLPSIGGLIPQQRTSTAVPDTTSGQQRGVESSPDSALVPSQVVAEDIPDVVGETSTPADIVAEPGEEPPAVETQRAAEELSEELPAAEPQRTAGELSEEPPAAETQRTADEFSEPKETDSQSVDQD
jgi:hypothetical protein